jgi:uncharacterized membrane protein
MFDLIGGLPLHPLVVHASVALIPLSAIGVLVYAFVPRWRATLRWPLLVVATIAAVSVPAAYFTGEPLRDRLGLAGSNAVQRHEGFAQQTLIVLFAWWLVVVALLWRAPTDAQSRTPWPPRWLLVLAVLLSLAGIAGIVATGHSGASSVWSPRVNS